MNKYLPTDTPWHLRAGRRSVAHPGKDSSLSGSRRLRRVPEGGDRKGGLDGQSLQSAPAGASDTRELLVPRVSQLLLLFLKIPD